MHQMNSPINSREMRALLLGSKQSLTPVDIPLPKAQKASWGKVMQRNRALIGVAIGLLIVATLVSVAPPLLP